MQLIRVRLAAVTLTMLAIASSLLISPSEIAHAVDDIIVEWHPGTEASGFHEYNCGWHDGSCTSPYDTSGSNIDFRNGSNDDVYWRSTGYYSASASLSPIGAGIHSSFQVGCDYVQVLFYDGFATLRGTGTYVHTEDNGSNFTVYGHDTKYQQETLIGSSSDWGTDGSDGSDPDCGSNWNGPHLHQGGSSFAHHFTSNYPSALLANTDGMPRSGTVWIDDNRLFQASWTE